MSSTYLTPHFSLAELTASQTAARHGLANTPDPAALANLQRLAETLETVRAKLGNVPVLVSSGYRSPAVNTRVGGSSTSAHKYGRAADFSAPRFGTPRQVCEAIIRAGIPFDQLIHEGTWVHLGLAERAARPRQQVLTAIFKSGAPTRYVVGIQ